jgi:hypothetical protein
MNKPPQIKTLSTVRWRSLPVILVSLLLVIPGLGQGKQNANDNKDPTVQLSRLQTVLFSYADKYMSAIAQVTTIARSKNTTSPELRLRMHTLKLLVTTSVQELAVSPNPESTLLDMMVFATLHRISAEGDRNRKLYGHASASIISAMRFMENEIWDIASDYLSEQDIAEVRMLIGAWLLENPDLKVVSFIRFSDFASMRSKSPLIEKTRSKGFLVDTSDALKAVDEALLLSERVLHYSQRLPIIIEFQIEKVFYQLALEPEIRQGLAQSRSMTQSLERFTNSIEKLPGQVVTERQASIEQFASVIATERSEAIRELSRALAVERQASIEDIGQTVAAERAALFSELDAREKMLTGIVSEARKGIGDADKLVIDLEKTSKAITEVLLNADKVMARFDSGPEVGESDSEPFDINSYVIATRELTIAIREVNTLMLSAERLSGGENLIGGVFDRALWTGTILILILCVAIFFTMLVYRAAARHIVPRSSLEYVGPPPVNRPEE